ncbi:hypothetical protein JCM8097_000307 [Rhodosporidiobolus ruineniae]
MAATFTIAPFIREDIPSLGRIFGSSFAPTEMFKRYYKNVTLETFAPWFTARMEGVLATRDIKGVPIEILVAKNGEGKVLGLAFFDIVPVEDEREPQPQRTLPEGADEAAFAWFTKVDTTRDQFPQRHLSLHILAVSPELQGGGIGKALLNATFDRARQEGIPVVLDSTELGKPMYEKVGFVPVDRDYREHRRNNFSRRIGIAIGVAVGLLLLIIALGLLVRRRRARAFRVAYPLQQNQGQQQQQGQQQGYYGQQGQQGYYAQGQDGQQQMQQNQQGGWQAPPQYRNYRPSPSSTPQTSFAPPPGPPPAASSFTASNNLPTAADLPQYAPPTSPPPAATSSTSPGYGGYAPPAGPPPGK